MSVACLCAVFIIAGDVGFGCSGAERVRIGLARPHSRFAPEPGNLELESAPEAMRSGWAAILYPFKLR